MAHLDEQNNAYWERKEKRIENSKKSYSKRITDKYSKSSFTLVECHYCDWKGKQLLKLSWSILIRTRFFVMVRIRILTIFTWIRNSRFHGQSYWVFYPWSPRKAKLFRPLFTLLGPQYFRYPGGGVTSPQLPSNLLTIGNWKTKYAHIFFICIFEGADPKKALKSIFQNIPLFTLFWYPSCVKNKNCFWESPKNVFKKILQVGCVKDLFDKRKKPK